MSFWINFNADTESLTLWLIVPHHFLICASRLFYPFGVTPSCSTQHMHYFDAFLSTLNLIYAVKFKNEILSKNRKLRFISRSESYQTNFRFRARLKCIDHFIFYDFTLEIMFLWSIQISKNKIILVVFTKYQFVQIFLTCIKWSLSEVKLNLYCKSNGTKSSMSSLWQM